MKRCLYLSEIIDLKPRHSRRIQEPPPASQPASLQGHFQMQHGNTTIQTFGYVKGVLLVVHRNGYAFRFQLEAPGLAVTAEGARRAACRTTFIQSGHPFSFNPVTSSVKGLRR